MRISPLPTVCGLVASHQMSAPGDPQVNKFGQVSGLWSWPPDVTSRAKDQGVPVQRVKGDQG